MLGGEVLANDKYVRCHYGVVALCADLVLMRSTNIVQPHTTVIGYHRTTIDDCSMKQNIKLACGIPWIKTNKCSSFQVCLITVI